MCTRAEQTRIIPATGLTVVVPHESPALDIVFVHGFTGYPERTWTHKRGDLHRSDDGDDDESLEPQHKSRRLNPFSSAQKANDHAHSSVYWPRDLLPTTVPGARVLTYGYDTHMRHWAGKPVAPNTVRDIAWDCLVALEAARSEDPARPLIFVVHSLGGIVVKELLWRSSGCRQGQRHLHDVFSSTTGIIFFGTPHGGSDPRGLLMHAAELVVKAIGFKVNQDIVNSLLPSSERLRELRDEFSPLAHEQNWTIHSFQEQTPVKALGRKVVEDVSSYLNFPAIEITEHIGRNHMDMCRFTGPDDIEYKKVAGALRRMTAKPSNSASPHSVPSLTDEQRQHLKASLGFEQIDARHMTIKSAHRKTCMWLKKKDEFVDWLNPDKLPDHHGFLWVKGKPGTGKSTLMKFAFDHARRTMKNKIIISFFFNARGETLEKSTEGMYRSLLLQLLERLPALNIIFDSLALAGWPQTGEMSWSIEALKDLFEEAVQALGQSQLVCFIDALDECDEDQIQDMRSFFAHLGGSAAASGIRFQVMLSSRHYPEIGRLPFGLEFILEGHDGHNQDLSNYIDSELMIGQSKIAEEIKLELQARSESSSIFMWVVLVVDILNKEYRRGRIHTLRKRLRELPAGLHELFRDILTRDTRDREGLILCIQWVLFSRTPLRPEAFYDAILAGTDPDSLEPHDDCADVRESVQRFITDSSKGLAETTKSKIPVVQFIHESVRDFLLKDDGLRKIWPDLGDRFQGQSHESLKQCCLEYITHVIEGAYLPQTEEVSPGERAKLLNQFPFIQYAIRNILYHADEAEHNGIDQGGFLRSFPLASWIHLDNVLEKFKVRHHKLGPDRLLYILAENNMAHLIKSHFSQSNPLGRLAERYGTPFFAALATGSIDAALAFAELQSSTIVGPPTPFQALCQSYLENPKHIPNAGRDFSIPDLFSRGLVRQDDTGLAELLLATGMFDNPRNISGRTPLWWAARNGHEAVARLLLSKPANTNQMSLVSTTDGSTPLKEAARGGHGAIIEMLLDNGADINFRAYGDEAPIVIAAVKGHATTVGMLISRGAASTSPDLSLALYRASEEGHEAVVKVLLDHGANPNCLVWKKTPLLLASVHGHETVVKILLDHGANPNCLGLEVTPLLLASREGHEATVKLLLDSGANANERAPSGDTPLSRAIEEGHEAVVKLLLDSGANVDAGRRGKTPLLLATKEGPAAVVKLLLERGSKIDEKDEFGRTPLSLAAESGREDVVMAILQHRPDINLPDTSGATPLSWGVLGGRNARSVAGILIENGASINATDCNGRTARSLAVDRGDWALVKFLEARGGV